MKAIILAGRPRQALGGAHGRVRCAQSHTGIDFCLLALNSDREAAVMASLADFAAPRRYFPFPIPMQPARTSTLDHFQAVAEGVFVALTPISTVGPAEIAFVKAQARSVVRRRARLCLHRSSYDRLHDMVIALDMATYLRPHRHADKSETFHII